MATTQRVLIIDGLNAFLRHFCINPTMDANGQAVGGVVGFIRGMKSIMRDVKPSHVIVAWDGKGGSSKRRGIYREYKAGRKPRVNRELGEDETVDESRANLQYQYGKLREYLSLLGVAQVEVEGCEADDVIGYLCRGVFSDVQKVVVSTDRDMLQLVDGRTLVFSPTRKELFTKGNFVQLVGVLPENFIYVKAISGDGSDNIAGIEGVGERGVIKTFPHLAEKASSLEEIKGYAEKSKSAKAKRILAGWDVITQNLGLMQLTNPIISAQSVRAIRYAVTDAAFSFNFSEFRLAMIRDGMQLPDADLLGVFTDYMHSFKKKDDDENV